MTIARIDLYTQPHKAQREWLFDISTLAGKINYNNKTDVEKLQMEFDGIIADLRDHSRAEEAFIHPLYDAKAIELKDPLLEDHHAQDLNLQHLSALFQTILITDDINKNEKGLHFYRAFNRFITDYLAHQDAEERTLYLLWATYSDRQLQAVMAAYKASHGQQKAVDAFIKLLPDLSRPEKERLISGIKKYAHANIYNLIISQAKIITPSNIYTIKNAQDFSNGQANCL
jgi:hemerythrin superfamily protein